MYVGGSFSSLQWNPITISAVAKLTQSSHSLKQSVCAIYALFYTLFFNVELTNIPHFWMNDSFERSNSKLGKCETDQWLRKWISD